MAYRDPHESIRALHAIAATQGGYFTAKQAASAGYDYPHLTYHLSAGNFERADHGLYRIVTIPTVENDQLIRLSLWSRDRSDQPLAVVSHETALALHDLSDVLPRRVHLTVPKKFRKPTPGECVLHRAMIAAADVELHNGFSVTTPLRTLLDVAAGDSVSGEQIARGVAAALQRGLLRNSKLKAAAEAALDAARVLRRLNITA